MGEVGKRGRAFAIVIVAALALLGAGVLALRAVFTPDRLRAEIARAGEAALGLPVDVGGARLALLPPTVVLEDVRVGGAAAEDPPLLVLAEGRARVDWLPLLRGRLVLAELRFDRPAVALRRDGKGLVLPGVLGASEPSATPPGRPGAAPPPTVIERLEITDGILRVSGPGPPGDVVLQGIDLRTRVELSDRGDRMRAAGELRLRNLSLAALAPWRRTLDALSPAVDFELDYVASAGTLAMPVVRLVAGPLALEGAGRIQGLPDAPAISFAVEPATVRLEELLPLLPPALVPEARAPRAQGAARVAARVEGPLGDPAAPPSWSVDLGFDGAELGIEGFAVALRDLRGDLSVTDGVAEFRALQASLGEGSIRVDGRVAGPGVPDSGRVDLAVKAGLDLALLHQAGFVPEGAEILGRVDADVALRGRTTAPEAADLRGTVTLAGGRIVLADLPVPVRDLECRLELEGASAALRSVSGALGSSAFRGEGRVDRVLGDPVVTLRGACPRLDLLELAPPPAAAGGPGEAVPAAEPLPPLVPELPPIRAHLELAVDSLLAPNTILAGCVLTADLDQGRARLTTRMAHAAFQDGPVLHDVEGEGTLAEGRLDATFRSPRAEAYRVPLSAVDGRVAVEGRRIDVSDVQAGLFTGRIEGTAAVDLADPVRPVFEIESRAAGIEANDLLSALTPARGVLHGKLDLVSTFRGEGLDPRTIAESLVANGTLNASEGRLARAGHTQAIWKALQLGEKEAIDFRKLTAPFSIRGGKLITENLEVGSPEANWRASGALGFDGNLDYRVQVELGDALAAEFRRRAGGELANLLAGSSGRITLDLKIDGPARSPSVSLDTSGLVRRLTENAADAARRGLGSARDRLVEQLVGPTPPDSAGGDAAPADSAAAAAKPTLEDALRGLLKKK
jgi:uncharacterized protein involved in outer membrane biogenesis